MHPNLDVCLFLVLEVELVDALLWRHSQNDHSFSVPPRERRLGECRLLNMGTRHDYSEVTERVETDLQLEEVGPAVIVLLINLEVSAVEVVGEIFSHSLPVPPKPAICLQELFKGGLQHVHNRSVVFPFLFERGRGEPQNVCVTGERERERL